MDSSEHSAAFATLYACPSRNGVSYPSRLRGEGVLMVNMRELFAFDRIGSQEMERVPLTVSERATSLLQEGDLLFARQSLVREGAGRVVIVERGPERTWEGHLIRVLLDRNKAVPRYYYYYFRSPAGRAQIESIVEQVAAAGIRGSDLGHLRVPVPALHRQRAIAEVLGALDDKIECNNRLHDCSHNLAAALLARVLGETEAEGTQSEGRLEDIAAVNVRKVEPAEGTLRYLDISSVGVGRADEPALMPWTEAPGRARRGVRNGDVLWSSVRPNRKSHCLVLDPPPDLVVSTGFAVLTPTKVGSSFLYGITEQPEFIGYLEAVAEGSAYPAVRADRFLDAPVRLVPTDVLASYEEETMPLRRRATTALSETRSLTHLRDTLLPRLLSGELRVRDAEAAVEAVA